LEGVPTREELRAVDATLRASAGDDAADHVLFVVGSKVGRKVAAHVGDGTPLIDRVRQGLALLDEHGLGGMRIDAFDGDLAQGRCNIDGHIDGSFEDHIGHCSRERPAHAASGLSMGLLSGLVSALSGIDVTCSPVACSACIGNNGCRFEVRSSHGFGQLDGPRHAPPGSARFFLGSVGASLAESEVSLDDLLETTSDAVVLIDNEDVVRFWNRGAVQMFQFTPEEVVGRKVGAIVPPDLRDNDELGTIRRRIDDDVAVVNHITRRVRKDGTELWCSLTRTPLHDGHGSVVGSAAVLRDITEQRRTEAELARARTLATIGEMSAKIAHEIKNPLAGIYAAVQVLARELPPADHRREIFDEIGEEVRRLDQTVIDMLRFARPVPPKPRPMSLRAALRDVVEPLRRAFPRVDVRVKVEGDMVLPLDERMISQVLENLVLNALQAVESSNGLVIVEARTDGPECVIEVRDDGPGVPPAARLEIFEPFVTTKTRGTGLGLPIARKNVEAHHGKLELDVAPEGGACFRVRLPRHDASLGL
jgi:PAS domain S-box-containing protein